MRGGGNENGKLGVKFRGKGRGEKERGEIGERKGERGKGRGKAKGIL